MKKILVVALILFATSAMASPFLVSDPATGVTLYKITGARMDTIGLLNGTGWKFKG